MYDRILCAVQHMCGRLQMLICRLHRRNGRQCGQKFLSYDAWLLRKKLEEAERNIEFLQIEQSKTRADNHALRQKFSNLKESFADVLKTADALFRKKCRFDVRETEDGKAWEVVTGYCCLGGCDTDIYTFQTEHDALLFAALLAAIDYKAPHNTACSSCYADYMRDCV